LVLNRDLIIYARRFQLVVDGANVFFVAVYHDKNLPRISAILGNTTVTRTPKCIAIDMRLQSRALGLLVEGLDYYLLALARIQELGESPSLSLLARRKPGLFLLPR